MYKILFNILVSQLSPYVENITVNHKCGFRRKWSTTDQIFYIRQILEREGEWEYNRPVRQLFMEFEKTYDSFRRKVLYSILDEFSKPVKLVRIIEMRSNEICSKARIIKTLPDTIPIQNGMK